MPKNQMIHCQACGQPMAASAKACPSCGAKNKQPLYKKWWFWVLVAIVMLGVAGGAGSASSSGAGGGTATGGAAPAAPTATPMPDLMLQGEVTVTEDALATYYEGVVVNNKDRAFSYAQITFTLYDADGNQLGTAIDNISDLKAHGTWKFKALALCDKDDIAEWELSEITGY